MVNTRKKSYVESGDESNQPSELADAAPASATRRTTRRSVSNATAASQTPSKEVATPVRRSRRLSNSSVESINDTPVPKSATRRSARGKTNTESGDESSDVEVLVIKRRRGAKDVPALVPITEEDKPNETAFVNVEEGSEAVQIEMKEEVGATRESPEKSEVAMKQEAADKETSSAKQNLQVPEVIDLRSPPPLVQVCREELSPQPSDGRISAGSDHSAESFKSIESPKNEANQTVDNIHLELETSNDEDSKQAESSGKDFEPSETNISAEPAPVTEQVAVEAEQKMEVSETVDSEPITSNDAKTDNVPSEDNTKDDQENIKAANENQESQSDKSAPSVGERLMKIAHSKPKKTETNNNASEKNQEKLPCSADILRNIPRGKSKSGRTWKQPKSNPRYLYQDKGMKMGLDKVTQLRQERQRIKEIEARLKEEKQARFAELARRKELNKKREEENARRGEVIQVIRNPNKIKRMKKKQLKLIQKRDTTGM